MQEKPDVPEHFGHSAFLQMTEQALLLGGMVGREGNASGIVAAGALPLYHFPVGPLCQSLHQGAVTVVNGHPFGLTFSGMQQKDTQHKGDNSGKDPVTFYYFHLILRFFPWISADDTLKSTRAASAGQQKQKKRRQSLVKR
jgi:hypothetical protein